jgi:hypothetical protein
LIFFGGQEWEDWEQKALDEYREYMKDNPHPMVKDE